MRLRALALATATGLVLTLAPATAAEAARKPAYKVSISTSTANPTVGATVKVTGKVKGPKAAKKRLLVQRKVGAGRWTTVAKVRTTKSRKYAVRVKVRTAGKHSLRVVAPKSSKARAGSSRVRGFTGWRWIDLTTQRHADEGTNSVGSVSIAGRTYPKAIRFAGGRYFKTNGACSTFRTSVGVPDTESFDGGLSFLEFKKADLSDEPTLIELDVRQDAAPLPLRTSVAGSQVIAFGGGSVAAVSPQVLCRTNSLPSFALPR
ncbi:MULTISPECIES: hypothetical protein [Aeromicrobium]|uniref:hypothetical protein n=1 Tax=Aeromicrobium TaxID=2040 RepID=UPI00257E0560|nr:MULTISPECIES: hypothetical protein [Aeromicrobium]